MLLTGADQLRDMQPPMSLRWILGSVYLGFPLGPAETMPPDAEFIRGWICVAIGAVSRRPPNPRFQALASVRQASLVAFSFRVFLTNASVGP